MNTARYGRYKKIVNGISICVFILAAITNYSLKKYGDLKLFPERMYHLAFLFSRCFWYFWGR